MRVQSREKVMRTLPGNILWVAPAINKASFRTDYWRNPTVYFSKFSPLTDLPHLPSRCVLGLCGFIVTYPTPVRLPSFYRLCDGGIDNISYHGLFTTFAVIVACKTCRAGQESNLAASASRRTRTTTAHLVAGMGVAPIISRLWAWRETVSLPSDINYK